MVNSSYLEIMCKQFIAEAIIFLWNDLENFTLKNLENKVFL